MSSSVRIEIDDSDWKVSDRRRQRIVVTGSGTVLRAEGDEGTLVAMVSPRVVPSSLRAWLCENLAALTGVANASGEARMSLARELGQKLTEAVWSGEISRWLHPADWVGPIDRAEIQWFCRDFDAWAEMTVLDAREQGVWLDAREVANYARTSTVE